MRIIARAALREFWESSPAYTDSKTPLVEWYRHLEKSTYHSPQDLKRVLRTASTLKGARVVFNIGGNKYRLVVFVKYEMGTVFIRFIGTHREYDKVKVEVV